MKQVWTALLHVSTLVLQGEALLLGDAGDKFPTIHRRTAVWYSADTSSEDVLKQLEENADLFDVVFARGCGLKTEVTDPLKPIVTLDAQEFEQKCGALMSRAKAAGLKVSMWLPVDQGAAVIPRDTQTSVQVDVKPLVASISELAKEHGWSGFGFEDETNGCSDTSAQERQFWLAFIDAWGRLLRYENLRFSVGVKLLTCPALPEHHSEEGELQSLGRHFSNSAVDEWVESDTEHGDLPSFFDSLDYYEQYMATRTLGISMPAPDENSLSRIHAMSKTEISTMVVSGLPVDTEYLRLVHNWKTRCDKCKLSGLHCWSADDKCYG